MLIPLALAAAAGISAGPVVQTPGVPEGHPRVYVRAADVPRLKQKVVLPEYQSAWEQVCAAAEKQPACAAFVYLVTGDQSRGRQAIAQALAALKTSDDARVLNVPLHQGAMVYDWCYDLLSPGEKQAFIGEFERIAGGHDPGYPGSLQGMAVVGHTTEGWVLTGQLPAGVAIYDESPTMYDAAARLFFEKFVPVRNFYFPSHWHHQGDSYVSRIEHDLAASWLFRQMRLGDVVSREQQFVPYFIVYGLRPDGQQLRRGDTYDEPGKGGAKRLIFTLAGAYYQDPYLLTLADSDLFWELPPFERIFELLFREPEAEKRPIAELPLTKYFPDPGGEMIARTGWEMGKDSPAAVVQMRIGGYFFGNHQRRDFGTFQVYYRGGLAIASGAYQGGPDNMYGSDHWHDYHHQTISLNGLLIFDPNEPMARIRRVNDGGQRVPNEGRDHPIDLETLLAKGYRMGEVTAHAFGPDRFSPEYSYIAGDITQAYTEKVRLVTRSMVTLNLRDRTYPAALIVFDRVVSSNPAFKKTWLLHTIEEPMIEGRTTTVVRTRDGYRGKLVAETLLPEQAGITKIGGPGKEFWVESVQRNFPTTKKPPAELGAWRVEVLPSALAESDLFLHVMTVMDADTTRGPTVTMVEGTNVVGVHLLDRAVFFARRNLLLRQADFELTGEGEQRVLVCDLAPGLWSVEKDGQPMLVSARPDSDGNCLSFSGEAGRYVLSLAAQPNL